MREKSRVIFYQKGMVGLFFVLCCGLGYASCSTDTLSVQTAQCLQNTADQTFQANYKSNYAQQKQLNAETSLSGVHQSFRIASSSDQGLHEAASSRSATLPTQKSQNSENNGAIHWF